MSKKALVADDERSMARFIEVTLQKLGYEVTTVFDGKSALQEVNDNTHELYVLDVAMPYADGFEVLEAVRKSPAHSHSKVVMLTAEDANKEVFKGYQLGADVYVTKPVTAQELIRVIEQI